MTPITEHMEIAVRAWAEPKYKDYVPSGDTKQRASRDLGPSEWSITFDTETTTDASQRLRIGSYQVRHGDTLFESGVFYEPDELTADEIDTAERFCAEHVFRLLTRRKFIEEVLLYYAYDLRGLLVGFNLPFDISRLATAHVKSRSKKRAMRGAFSFTISDKPSRPRVQVKRASGRAALIRFAEPQGRSPERRNQTASGDASTYDGYIVDVSVLASALLGQTFTLASLADMLETEHRKLDLDDFDQPISEELLTYAIQDVQVTWECYEKLSDRYIGYGLTLTPIHRVLSEASIGKAHLRQIGLTPWRRLEVDFPDWLIAAAMESYYGGRAETRIRRAAIPGVLVDFASQYPTAYVLQGLWRFQIAQTLRWHEEDPQLAQAIVDRVNVDDVLDPATWGELHRLVLVQPGGDALPTRARYQQRRRRAGKRQSSVLWNVGISLRVGGPSQWWTLSDVVASKLETGRAPVILRSILFEAGPPQARLRLLDVAGDPAYRVEPYEDDAIQRLVELRRHVKRHEQRVEADGDAAAAARLDSIQLALKIAANAISYGIGIELNVQEYTKPIKVSVHRPDETPYQTKSRRVEEPGQWFHPIIATLVSSGGRLLLAAAMRLVHDAGGEYVFCDTDSLFIAAMPTGGTITCPGAPGDQLQALSWAQVTAVTQRFELLNPFDGELVPGSLLEVEDENFDPTTGTQREIECFSIAAKRYALFQRRSDGTPELVGSGHKRRRSEHGLGHLMSPLPRDSDDNWYDLWWDHLLHIELGCEHAEPEWFDQAAIGKLSIGSFHELVGFTIYNKDRPYWEQVRPFGFLTIAHPAHVEALRPGGPRCLVAPYEKDPALRMRKTWWFDRHQPEADGHRIRTTHPIDHIDAIIAVKSYRDYFDDYRLHREAKAADPDGQPCHTSTQGLLQPHTIEGSGLVRIGKEANRLTESSDLALDDHDRAIIYPDPRTCHHCSQPLTGRQRRWCSDTCRKQHQRNIG